MSDWLWLVHMDRVKCSRIGQFNARVKRAQIENSPSYCINACDLRRSERAIMKLFAMSHSES